MKTAVLSGSVSYIGPKTDIIGDKNGSVFSHFKKKITCEHAEANLLLTLRYNYKGKKR
uniref:Uncharacterized protein n=1 Tax=Lepeophtheirus salmonis TaxID=72036 RepID=A0A0K2TNA9_LEPSM